MPPSYKPLAAGVQGIPEEIFNNPGITFEDAIKQQALARAQELNNQQAEQRVRSQEMQITEEQRQLQDEAARRDAIIAEFGTGAGEFDPEKAMRTAQRVALQSGDVSTALEVEKALRARRVGGGVGGGAGAGAKDQPLSPEQLALMSDQLNMDLPPGTTPNDIARLTGVMRTNTYANQVSTYVGDPNRELNAEMKRARIAGEQVTKPSERAALSVGASNSFVNDMDRMLERYIPYISENRGERFLAASANPNSAAARFMKEINLKAKQAALALEDRVTDQDYKVIQELATPSPLDTMETMVDKAKELQGFVKRRTQENLTAMEAANINVAKLKRLAGMGATPVPSPVPSSGIPLNPDGTPLSREQFMALRNRGQ